MAFSRSTTADGGAWFDTYPGMGTSTKDSFVEPKGGAVANEHAWTEDQPARLRQDITNVRTFAAGTTTRGTPLVEYAELLFRIRGRRQRGGHWVLRSPGSVAPLRRHTRTNEIGRRTIWSRVGRGCRTWRVGNDALTEVVNGAVGRTAHGGKGFNEVVVTHRVEYYETAHRLLISAL